MTLLLSASPEVEVFEGKLGLDDTGGLYSGSQHVLLSGHITGLDQSLQVIQVAVERSNAGIHAWSGGLQELHPLLSSRVVELVLGGPVKARLDARVFPQAQDDVRQLFGHGALLDGVCKMHELPGVVL